MGSGVAVVGAAGRAGAGRCGSGTCRGAAGAAGTVATSGVGSATETEGVEVLELVGAGLARRVLSFGAGDVV